MSTLRLLFARITRKAEPSKDVAQSVADLPVPAEREPEADGDAGSAKATLAKHAGKGEK